MKNKKDINEKSLDIYNDDFDKNIYLICNDNLTFSNLDNFVIKNVKVLINFI